MDSRICVFLVAAAAFVIAARGRLHLSTDATFYLSLADAIRAGKVAVFISGSQATFTLLGFASLLAGLRAIAPAHWQFLMLVVNVACAAATAVLLAGIVRKATSSLAAAVVALGAYVGCFDVFHWVGFLLTDHVYTMISMIAFWLVLRGVDPDARNRFRRVTLWLAVVLATVARPVGVVLLPVVTLTEWMRGRREKGSWRAMWLFIIAGGVAAFMVHAYFFQDMGRWPTQWLRPKLQEYAALEHSGEVMRGHREMFHRPPITMTDHVMIEVDRFVRFFQITSITFSRPHNVVAVVYYVPLYALMLLGIFDGLKSSDGRCRVLVHTALLWLVAMDFFCAATNLDYDWRYRLPLMPQIILLAACGFEAVMRRFLPRSSLASAATPAS
jgi:hypothetical protein